MSSCHMGILYYIKIDISRGFSCQILSTVALITVSSATIFLSSSYQYGSALEYLSSGAVPWRALPAEKCTLHARARAHIHIAEH